MKLIVFERFKSDYKGSFIRDSDQQVLPYELYRIQTNFIIASRISSVRQRFKTDEDESIDYEKTQKNYDIPKIFKSKIIESMRIEKLFKKAAVEVQEDTMAAVYATINSPTEAAVVCILGTGSNCSYYDGKIEHKRVKSLGYSIMDDASGNYYGRQLIRDYYFNNMPEDVKIAFETKFNVDDDYIKYNLYKQPNPNAYLASFAEFMFLHKDSAYIINLIKTGIRLFATTMIMQFKEEIKTVPVHFAGSIAFFSKPEIEQVAQEMGFKVGNIERRPIEGLVAFHTGKS